MPEGTGLTEQRAEELISEIQASRETSATVGGQTSHGSA